ncbi:MAG: DUF2884 family protein [Bacillota bacterium]
MLFGACLAAAATVQADVRMNANRHSNISFDGNAVVIAADDDSEARVTSAGDLIIRGKTLTVTAEQRKLLQQYYGGLRDIENRGLAIGEHAVHMVGGMLGGLVEALFDNDDDADLDRRMREKAEPLKEEARALCKDVQTERTVQDEIAGEIPAFKPYAVINTESDHDCHIDNHDIEV